MFGLHLLVHLLMRSAGERTTNSLLRPFLGFLDGSDEPAELRPLYSMAEARRKQGLYLEAREHVCAQLEKFPTDFQGQMLLAEIEAVDLHDLTAADLTIQKLVAQEGHSPANVFYALTTLADWQLKFARDRDAACRSFEQITALYPGTEWELAAAQRIAHLPSSASLMDAELRTPIKVPHISGDAGLDGSAGVLASAQDDPQLLAGQYVKRLEEFPLDWEARESLARIYAEHFQRLDLAESQIEQLIQYPNQPTKQVVRWLNMIADLHVKHGGTYEGAAGALQRIIELNPNAAAAHVAQNRIELLRLEFRGKEKSQAVTLGSYEDDLGLKGGPPTQ